MKKNMSFKHVQIELFNGIQNNEALSKAIKLSSMLLTVILTEKLSLDFLQEAGLRNKNVLPRLDVPVRSQWNEARHCKCEGVRRMRRILKCDRKLLIAENLQVSLKNLSQV